MGTWGSVSNAVAVWMLGVGLLAACGGDDDEAGNARGGTASVGGGAGGASTAGASTGGTSGSAPAGASGSSGATSAHCSPGSAFAFGFFVGGIVDKCPLPYEGISGDPPQVDDIEMPEPVAPGETFAFSVEMTAGDGDFVVYGVPEECGALGEKLSTVHVTGNGTYCFEIKPTAATYTHLVWVWGAGAGIKAMAMCSDGMCPR